MTLSYICEFCSNITNLMMAGGVFGIGDKEIAKLNKTSSTLAQFPESMGDGYLTTLQVYHQLHCLVSMSFPGTLGQKLLTIYHEEHDPQDNVS
jgi:hypothetical protein